MRDESHEPDYASLAARALAAGQPSTVPPPIEDRAETIAAIERALRARTRRRLRPWWVFPPLTAAAAAVVLLVAGGRGGREGRDSGHPALPMTAADLRAGAELSGPSSIEIAFGTRLHLAAHSTAKVMELGTVQRFSLETGGLRAEVAKLTAGRRFLIETPDAEIEVKGTRFDVSVAPVPSSDCGPRTRTRVTVHEGVVAVRFARKEVRLGPGAEWPDCSSAGAAKAPVKAEAPPPFTTAQVSQTTRPTSRASTVMSRPNPGRPHRGPSRATAIALAGPTTAPAKATTTAPATTAEAAAAAVASTAPSPAPAPTHIPVAVPGSSTLADQNDLLAAALAARHRGDVAEALRWLDRLLNRYPDGQLVDSARAERRRLLEGSAPLGERESE